MAAKRFSKTALYALAAVWGATLAVCAETQAIEYQANGQMQALLENEQAPVGNNGHFADATAAPDVRAGLHIYKVQCSGCHGRQLQGQALWQAQDAYAGLRAPAQDATGHSWQHSDEDLFRKVQMGTMGNLVEASQGASDSARHAFGTVLSDAHILQVLAFIKARWPLGMRVAQSTLNPQFQGMPIDAQTVEWTFPPTCLSSK